MSHNSGQPCHVVNVFEIDKNITDFSRMSKTFQFYDVQQDQKHKLRHLLGRTLGNRTSKQTLGMYFYSKDFSFLGQKKT